MRGRQRGCLAELTARKPRDGMPAGCHWPDTNRTTDTERSPKYAHNSVRDGGNVMK